MSRIVMLILLILLGLPGLADSPDRIDFQMLSRELRQLEQSVAQLRAKKGTDNSEYTEAYTKLVNLRNALRSHPYAEHVTLPPLAKVTAKDAKTGKSETREAACREPHATYSRPAFRLPLPKLDINEERQTLLDSYRELETRLAEHMVVCHVDWFAQGRTALEWDNRRRAYIQALLTTERSLALAYSGARDQTHFVSLARAEGALKEANSLEQEAFALEARFAELEELEKKYRTVCEAFIASRTGHKLYSRFYWVHTDLIRKLDAVRARQAELGNQAHQQRRVAVELKKAMDKRRLAKGLEEINIRLRIAKKGPSFVFHKATDFNASSSLMSEMIGASGLDILLKESALRRHEIRRTMGR